MVLIECELRSAVLQDHESLLKDAGGIEASIELGGGESEGIFVIDVFGCLLVVVGTPSKSKCLTSYCLSTFTFEKQY